MDVLSLPTEIAEAIFEKLSKRSLLQCSFVCRAWQQSPLLHLSRLYHTITLKHSYQVIPFLVSLIHSEQNHCGNNDNVGETCLTIESVQPTGHYVRRLCLSEDAFRTCLLWFDMLQRLCPLVKYFDPVSRLSEIALPHWPQVPKYARHSIQLSTALMPFEHLTHLTWSEGETFASGSDYIRDHWVPMPQLQQLALKYWLLEIDNFHTLHACSPQLHTLKLDECYLSEAPPLPLSSMTTVSNKEQRLTRTPALKSLKLRNLNNLNDDWVRFFRQFYTEIEQFELVTVPASISLSTVALADIIHSFRRLRFLRLDHSDTDNDICLLPYLSWDDGGDNNAKTRRPFLKELQLDNAYCFHFSEKSTKYHEGYSRIMQQMETSLEKLVLTPPTICPGMPIGSLLISLSTCQRLTNLTLDFSSCSEVYYDWEENPWVADGEICRDLFFDYYPPAKWFSVSLPAILEACQHLISLTIVGDHSPFTVTGNTPEELPSSSSSSSSSLIGRENNLRQLVLADAIFDHSLLTYINDTCRRLTMFAFDASSPSLLWQTTKDGGRYTDISLPNIGLTMLNLHYGTSYSKSICVTETENHNETKRWYQSKPCANANDDLQLRNTSDVWQELSRSRIDDHETGWQLMKDEEQIRLAARQNATTHIKCKYLKEITAVDFRHFKRRY